MANDALLLSIVHKGISISASVSKVASYFVQIFRLQDASTASAGKSKFYEQGREPLGGPLGMSFRVGIEGHWVPCL